MFLFESKHRDIIIIILNFLDEDSLINLLDALPNFRRQYYPNGILRIIATSLNRLIKNTMTRREIETKSVDCPVKAHKEKILAITITYERRSIFVLPGEIYTYICSAVKDMTFLKEGISIPSRKYKDDNRVWKGIQEGKIKLNETEYKKILFSDGHGDVSRFLENLEPYIYVKVSYRRDTPSDEGYCTLRCKATSSEALEIYIIEKV